MTNHLIYHAKPGCDCEVYSRCEAAYNEDLLEVDCQQEGVSLRSTRQTRGHCELVLRRNPVLIFKVVTQIITLCLR